MGWNTERAAVCAGLGLVDSAFNSHLIPLFAVALGLPLQAVRDKQGRPSNVLDGLVDGGAALLGRAIGAHSGYYRPVGACRTGACAEARGYAAGYRELPARRM